MKHIDLIIATRNRNDKLKKTIGSIPSLPYLTIKIIYDGDDQFLSTYRKDIQLYHNVKHEGSVHCRNILTGDATDGVLYATDDIIFEEGCIEKAFYLFNKTFKDDDGVVGIKQREEHHPTGVALVGQKFLQRYPNNYLFYPAYYHFACQEVYWLATDLKKFIISEESFVKHYHPSLGLSEIDKTHNDARKYKREDMNLINHRLQEGSVWGR